MSLESPEQRIAELERKVSDLYKFLNRAEPTEWGGTVSDEVRQLVASGDKLRAIKMHVEQTGVDLGEAKHAIERVERGE